MNAISNKTPLTGTHFAYFQLCPRKAFLYHKGVRCENEEESYGAQRVALGRLDADVHYNRRPEHKREFLIEIDGLLIRPDFFDPTTGRLHESKLSNKRPDIDAAQCRFYAHVLEKAGFEVKEITVEYPKQRKKEAVDWNDEQRRNTAQNVGALREALSGSCPSVLADKVCRKCAYEHFCYA